MEIAKIELQRQTLILMRAKNLVYNNTNHILGADSYNDKKMISNLETKIFENQELMTTKELQFLETLYEKY
jgi:hypothetical protein